MTELERRALLGDKESQEQCTANGIVLSCPFCGSEWTQVRRIDWENTPIPFRTGFRGECTVCHSVSEAYITREEALLHWNTRPAPPIGRCRECEYKSVCCHHNGRYIGHFEEYDYCSYFKPKEK